MTNETFQAAQALVRKIAVSKKEKAEIVQVKTLLTADPTTPVSLRVSEYDIKIPAAIADTIITTLLNRYNTQLANAQAELDAL